MRYTPKSLGWKLYGLYEFSKIGLFNKKFVILNNVHSKQEIINKLKKSKFKDNNEIAIRFSKDNAMHLPFFLGKYTLEEIAEIIIKEKKDYVPFVHDLIKPKITPNIYFDGKQFLVELWPGIGASKKRIHNESPDIIIIDKTIKIARYLKNRKVENSAGKEFISKPYKFAFLLKIAKKINSKKSKLSTMLKIQKPLLCDAHIETLKEINFMGIQKTSHMNIEELKETLNQNFYVVKNINDLYKYDGTKKILLDIKINRNKTQWSALIQSLKKFPEIHLKSLTMHLAVILREQDINVKKGIIQKDYEIKEF